MLCPVLQGAMSNLFISRVFEEHVAPRRGATWPPHKQPQQQPGSSSSDGGASAPSSPSKRLGSLPAISDSSPPRSPASRPLASTHSSRKHGSSGGDGTNSSSGGAWPPPLPPGAACARDEMDLLSFATFVLAWDHRNQPAAIPYFFKIFDIHQRVSACCHCCCGGPQPQGLYAHVALAHAGHVPAPPLLCLV